MKHAVVSGGAGFIGSHLCAALLARDVAVTCIDNLSTGRESNVAALLKHPRFTLCIEDVASARRFLADLHWERLRHSSSTLPARPASSTTFGCPSRLCALTAREPGTCSSLRAIWCSLSLCLDL